MQPCRTATASSDKSKFIKWKDLCNDNLLKMTSSDPRRSRAIAGVNRPALLSWERNQSGCTAAAMRQRGGEEAAQSAGKLSDVQIGG